ncbi:MAG: Gfo/Idh/MocA family oxidoreductase [bacterium]
MSEKNALDRRDFLKSTGTIAVALTALSHQAKSAVGPNETIRVGCIGVGGMGTGRLKEFMRQDDTEVVAVCDVDRDHLESAATLVEEATNKKPCMYKDFRELLDRNDIDAVTVTTPDHWHALPFVYACETGKDVFVEKPLCHCLYEGQKMVEAANKYKRISQMGNHIHADMNYRKVVQIVRSGILGDTMRIQVWKTSGFQDLGKPADTNPPDGLDYDFWLGPAPKRPYNPLRSHFNFRYFWDYSGGVFADFWCHISDIAYWALGLKAPRTITAVGGRWHANGLGETPDTLEVTYDYDGVPLVFTVNPTGVPGFLHIGGIGCMIQGSKGTVVTNYGQHEVYIDNKKVDAPDLGNTPEIEPSPGHVRQFLDCVKTRNQPDCNVNYSYTLVKGLHLGLIAFKTGETLTWDDEKERFIQNSQANRLLKRRYRRPWKL